MLCGLAMATAGSSRPCSGGDHEILHAIDHLFPGTAGHGELAGAASLFTAYLRGEEGLAAGIGTCLARHGLPRTPADLGLSERAVRAGRRARAADPAGPLHDPRAPRARRRRRARAGAGVRRGLRLMRCRRSPSCAVRTQPDSIFARNSGEHWAGKLYMRRLLAVPDAAADPHAAHAQRRDVADDRSSGWPARAVLTLPGLWPAVARGGADPAPAAARLLRRRAGPLARRLLARRHLPRPAGAQPHGGRAARSRSRSAPTAAGTRSAAGPTSAC